MKDKYAAQNKYRLKNIEKYKAYNKEYSRLTRNNPRYRYTRLKARCRQLGRKFRISLQTYLDMIKSGCHYCGTSLMDAKGGSLDRVNNSNYNYTTRNVRPCCNDCNNLKNYQLTEGETLYVVKKLKAYRKKHGHKKYKSNQDIRKATEDGEKNRKA